MVPFVYSAEQGLRNTIRLQDGWGGQKGRTCKVEQDICFAFEVDIYN